MKYFPMFLRLEGQRVLIAGGGDEAVRKLRLLLKTEAEIAVMAPTLDPEIAALVASGRVKHHPVVCEVKAMEGVRLAFVATGCAGADAAIGVLAHAAGAIVNVVDRPELCDAITPSIVDRDPLVVAIGTEGAAPVLARQVKTLLETALEPHLGDLVALVGRLRGAVAQHLPMAQRRAFYRWAFDGPARAAHAAGREREAASILKTAIAQGGAPEARRGFVSIVGSGGGGADMMTVRGVQRLQEADAIFHDAAIDPQILEYARRDADRIDAGAAPGGADERAARLMLSTALAGRRVVRLVPGDARADPGTKRVEQMLTAADVDYEIVPGVADQPSTKCLDSLSPCA